MNSKHFIGIDGYMLVYSVGSKQSFEMVNIIRDKILNHLVNLLELSILFPNTETMMLIGDFTKGC